MSGCTISNKIQSNDVDFVSYYKQLDVVIDNNNFNSSFSADNLTLSVKDMPLINFVRVLANATKYSIVVDQKLDDKPVSLDIKDQPIHEVLTILARRLDVNVGRSGTMYFIGDIKPEDRGVYVRKVRRVSSDDLNGVLDVLRSTSGRGSVLPGGIVVIGDRVELLRRIDDMFNQIESAPANSFCVQLFVLSVSDNYLCNVGLDSNFSMDMTYNITKASSSIDSSFALNGVLSSMLNADKTDSSIRTVTRPTFFVQDGVDASFHSGEKIKVPLKTVSDSGTVSTTGYEDIDTGLKIDIKLIECKDNMVTLDLSLVNSDIYSYTDGVPNLSTDEFSVTSVLNSGIVYLLGSFDSNTNDESVNGIFSLAKSDNKSARQYMIWGRIFKVL